MPFPKKKSRSHSHTHEVTDSDSTRTPSPTERESRPHKQKRSGKSIRLRYSHESLNSKSPNSPSPAKRSRSKRDHKEKEVLEQLVSLLSGKCNTETLSSVGPGLQGSQNVIPGFNPNGKTQTMKNWLAKVNESAHVFGWTERQTIFYALPKLEGLAKMWYEGLVTVKFTWAEWQNKLMIAFPCDHNYGELLTEMLSRKSHRNETLEEYYYDKMMLINRCELTGKQAVDCISHGIYDYNVKMNVQGGDFKEPEEVLKYIRNISNRNSDMIRKPLSLGDSSSRYTNESRTPSTVSEE